MTNSKPGTSGILLPFEALEHCNGPSLALIKKFADTPGHLHHLPRDEVLDDLRQQLDDIAVAQGCQAD